MCHFKKSMHLLKAARAHRFISQLPRDYTTVRCDPRTDKGDNKYERKQVGSLVWGGGPEEISI